MDLVDGGERHFEKGEGVGHSQHFIEKSKVIPGNMLQTYKTGF